MSQVVPSAPLSALAERVLACRRCQAAGLLERAAPRLLGLAERLQAPPAPFPRVLVVGQAPGRYVREPAASPYQRALADWLARAGFPPDEIVTRVHFTALTRCYPGRRPSGGGDRVPGPAEVASCAEYLHEERAVLRPAVIVTVGARATALVAGGHAPLTDLIGTGWEADGVRYLPLPHPSGVSRWHNRPANQVLLAAALALLASWRQELAL